MFTARLGTSDSRPGNIQLARQGGAPVIVVAVAAPYILEPSDRAALMFHEGVAPVLELGAVDDVLLRLHPTVATP